MANRNWCSGGKVYSMDVSPVMLNCTIQIGATGAVSSFTGSTVASVTRVSTGIYKIKLQAQTNFPKLLFAAGSAQSAAAALSGVGQVEIQNDPNTSAQTADGAELTIKALDFAGAVVDPVSGSALNILMLFNNSSVVVS